MCMRSLHRQIIHFQSQLHTARGAGGPPGGRRTFGPSGRENAINNHHRGAVLSSNERGGREVPGMPGSPNPPPPTALLLLPPAPSDPAACAFDMRVQ